MFVSREFVCVCARLRSVCEQRVCVFVRVSKGFLDVEFVCVCARLRIVCAWRVCLCLCASHKCL